MTTDASTASEAVTAFTISYSGHYGSTIAVDEGATADSARAIIYSRGMEDTEHDTVPYYIDFTRADDAASQYATLKETLDNGTYNFMTSKVRQLSIVGYDNVDAWVADVEFVLGEQHYNFTYIYLVAYHDDLLVSIMGFDEKTGKFSMSKGLCSFGSVATDEDNAKFINVILGSIGVTEQITIPTYTVTFESNGGSDVTVQTVGVNATVSKPTDPVRDGYVFIAWYSDSSLTQQYDFSAQVTADLTLYAKWVASDARFTINYDSQGGSSVASQTVMAGRYASKPTDPTRDGYTFNGWYTDAGCTASFSFNTRIYEDTMLYAGWISNANSGAIAAAREFIDNYDGEYTGYSASGGNVEGYSLGNGSDERSATAVTYNLGMSDLNNATTAYAISYTVYDDAASATARYEKIASDAGRSRSDGGLYEFMGSTLSQINLTGYSQVSAWKNDVTTPVIFTMCYVVACHDNIVVTTMMYKDDSESAMSPYGSVEYGQTSTVAWDLEFINAILTSIGADKVTSPDLRIYTLTFESNGGSAVESQTVNVGEIPTKPTDPTREGYLFGGWYTDKDLTQQYNFSSTITSDTTLYAKWVVSAQRTVTFSNATVSANGSALTTGAKVADSTRLTIKPDTAPSGTVPTVMVNGKPVDARFGSYSYTVLGDDVKIDVTYYEKYTAKMCGDNAYWVFDPETGNLTIAGSGRMDDFSGGEVWAGTIYGGNDIKSVVVEDGITYVGAFAFAAGEVSIVTIGKDVVSMGQNPFSSRYLETIVLNPANTAYTVIDGVLYNVEKTEIIVYPAEKKDESFTVPDTVTSIGSLFGNHQYLKYLTLGRGISSIGDEAFAYGSLVEVTIPESVKTIGVSAFQSSSLKTIQIPGSIQTIGENAFSKCLSLESVVLENGIVSIGSSVFEGCSSLISIKIPDSVSSCGSNLFVNCSSLKIVELGKNTADVSPRWFVGCSSLQTIAVSEESTRYTSSSGILFNKDMSTLIYCPISNEIGAYTVPDTVVTINNDAFYGNQYLADVYLGNSVTTIGSNAFSASTITGINIGNKVTSIGNNAFGNCEKLSTVTLGKGLSSINEGVFHNCILLATIVIPDSVKEIGREAFSQCSSLNSVTFGKGLTSIGSRSFADCTSLLSLLIPSTVTEFGVGPFVGLTFYDSDGSTLLYKNPDLNDIKNIIGISFVGNGNGVFVRPSERIVEFSNSSVSADGKTIVSGSKITDNTVLTITPDAAEDGQIVTVIVNGTPLEATDGVYTYTVFRSDVNISITYAAFSVGGYCGADGDNLTWKFDMDSLTLTISGTGAMKDYTTSPWAVITDNGKNAVQKVVIGNGVTSIGNNAFKGCATTSLELPDSVKTIGQMAFMQCTSLASVSLGKVTDIGAAAFYLCPFESIVLPDTLTSIGSYAFIGTSIKTVTVPSSVKTINGVFDSCQSLESVILSPGVQTIGDEAFNNCIALTSVSIPSSVTTIGNSAFKYCSALKSIVLPDSVVSIGDNAFDQCSALTSITLDSSLKSIGSEAFNQSGLVSLSIPDSVTSLGKKAFYMCVDLTDLTIGKGVSTIGESVFEQCTSLKSVIIPDTVSTLGLWSFGECTKLTSLTVPGSVSDIDAKAFSGLTIYDADGTTVLTGKALAGYTYTGSGDGKLTRVVNQV